MSLWWCSSAASAQARSYQVGTRYQVPGTQFPLPDTRYLVTGTKYLVPNTEYQVPGARYLLGGTWCLVLGIWYQVPGTRHQVRGTGLLFTWIVSIPEFQKHLNVENAQNFDPDLMEPLPDIKIMGKLIKSLTNHVGHVNVSLMMQLSSLCASQITSNILGGKGIERTCVQYIHGDVGTL